MDSVELSSSILIGFAIARRDPFPDGSDQAFLESLRHCGASAEIWSDMNPGSVPDAETLRSTLAHLYANPAALAAAIEKLLNTNSGTDAETIDGVDLDLQRRERCGFPEVVFGEGKSAAMIVSILEKQRKAGQDSLVTRVRPDQSAELLSAFPDAIYNDTARTLRRHVTPEPAPEILTKIAPVAGSTCTGRGVMPSAELTPSKVVTLFWSREACIKLRPFNP